MGSVTNILGAQATVYKAAYGEALPELNDLDTGLISPAGNWTQVGFTMDDCLWEHSPSQEWVKINESAGEVKGFNVGEAQRVAYTLAEADMTAVAHAITGASVSTTAAAADQTAQDIVTTGDLTLTEYALLIIGTSPEGYSRLVYVPKCVQSGTVTLIQKRGHSGIPVEWKVLADMTRSAGDRMVKLYDLTAVPTS